MDAKLKTNAFEKELLLIENLTIRKLAREALSKADDWFFIEPASSSGKYHPDFARGASGLVLHTKAVVYFLVELIRSDLYGIDSYHRDLLILSAITHDIKKYGDGNKVGHTVNNHPELASIYIENINNSKKGGYISEVDIEYVKKCIERHMGVFGDSIPQTDDEKLLHLADLIASRKEIDLKFSNDEKKKAMPSIDEYKIDFGKHIGENIRNVPIDYLEWAIKNVTKRPVFLSLAKQIINEQKNKINNDSNE